MDQFFKDVAQLLIESRILNLIGAGALLLLGWLIALGAARRITRLTAEAIRPKGSKNANLHSADTVAGRIVYWLILLLTILGCLSVLNLQEAALPLREFARELSQYVPNLAGAVLLGLAAWVTSGIVRSAAVSLLMRTKLAESLGSCCHGKSQEQAAVGFGKLIGFIVWLFFLPAILKALRIYGITAPLELMFAKLLTFLPNLLAALLLVLLARYAGTFAGNAVAAIAEKCGLNRFFETLGFPRRKEAMPFSTIIGKVTMIAVMLLALLGACEALQLAVLSGLLRTFARFGGNLLLSLAVLMAGFWAANLVSCMLKGHCGVLGSGAVRCTVIFFAVAVALSNLKIGTGVIQLAFGLAAGAAATAFALAFGLGGKECAAKFLEQKCHAAHPVTGDKK